MTFTMLILLMVSAFAVSACGSPDATTTDNTKVTATEVTQESKEALTAMKTYTGQQKEAYQQQLETQLQTWRDKITALRAKAERASTDAKADLQDRLDALQEKYTAAKDKAAQLGETSATAWDDVKTGVDAALDDVQRTYDQAVSRFQ